MNHPTLFDIEPVVRSGVSGTTVLWPSGAEVWVTDERIRAAMLAMMSATSREHSRLSAAEREQFDREVMAPLRDDLRSAVDAAVSRVILAGDPS